MSCTAGRAILKAIDEDGTMRMRNAKETGTYLKTKLKTFMIKLDVIGDVRGRVLMMGVGIVTDRTLKEPAEQEAGRIVDTAKVLGIIIGKGGAMGNMLRINPPLCIQKEDMDGVADVLETSFQKL